MIRIVAVLACCLLGGCVERLVTVRSDPPGATVKMDDEVVGKTPCDVGYLWYGTREFTVEMAGYRSISRLVELSPPWWQYFPLDLLTDVFVPFTIRDQTELRVVLEPEPATIEEAAGVLKRAYELIERQDVPEK